MLHQKADGVAAASASEAFEDLLGRGYGERRGFFIMKRTKTEVIGAPFFQFHKTADNFRNVNAAEDLLYGLRRDHLNNCGFLMVPG